MKQIIKALLEAQKEMGNAKKDSDNPFFKSKYADLNSIREACMPALNKHSIVVLQPIIQIEGKNYIKTLLMHESGETLECTTEIIYSRPNDAQSQGSGITYARRYGLQSFLNVGADDDDGNKASVGKVTNVTNAEKLKVALPTSGEVFDKARTFIQEGGAIEDIEKKYVVSSDVKKLLIAK